MKTEFNLKYNGEKIHIYKRKFVAFVPTRRFSLNRKKMNSESRTTEGGTKSIFLLLERARGIFLTSSGFL